MKYDFRDFLYCPVRYFQILLKFDKNILHLRMLNCCQLHKIADSDTYHNAKIMNCYKFLAMISILMCKI